MATRAALQNLTTLTSFCRVQNGGNKSDLEAALAVVGCWNLQVQRLGSYRVAAAPVEEAPDDALEAPPLVEPQVVEEPEAKAQERSEQDELQALWLQLQQATSTAMAVVMRVYVAVFEE
ncbi:unnamed protein product [Symbiodinium natans]|uniref:Uncharacterized protein n=1 Tax=Symbiodinium natans TaxID=878477 RepID=A0A812INA3_9DINO|nr:unnamed protein product [Symbiodinium natans]